MSSVFGNTRRSRTRSPVDDYAKKSLLAKVGKSELKLLRVAVRRNDVIGGGPILPLERNIDDPARICTYVHYRKDENKRLQPPIFGRGIKVNQDFTENRLVFTHDKDGKSSIRSRSRSSYRSRSPRNQSNSQSRRAASGDRDRYRARSIRKRSESESRDATGRGRSKYSAGRVRNRSRSESRKAASRDRSSNRSRRVTNRNRSASRETTSRDRWRNDRSKSRSRSRSKRKRSTGRNGSSRMNLSRDRSKTRERRYSSERKKYKDNFRHYPSRRSRSPSRSRSPHEHEPSCPMFELRRHEKSLTPLRPGEYRPGHPDLALRTKRQRARSRSNGDRERSKDRSPSRDFLPSTSKDRSSLGRPAGSSRSSKSDRKEHNSRSPIKSDRYRRGSRSPYNSRSPTKRSYKGDKNRSPRRRTRSPQYRENVHGEYGYFEGWGPGPRLPVGRGGYPMQPFFPPGFHPRGMMPGPMLPPGHMIIPRMPIMPPYGPYRPHLPIYNSGAVKQRGPRASIKPATVTSEKEKDDDSEEGRVVITEANGEESGKKEDNVQNGSEDGEKT